MPKPKTDYVQVRISPELKIMIQKAAEEDDKTRSQFILDAVKAELKRRGKER